MSNIGHNIRDVELKEYAVQCVSGFLTVKNGEGETLEGWFVIGHALNGARALFHPEDDKGFGQWVAANLLSQHETVEFTRDERAAAMWAAANQDDFDTARAAGNRRTVRGIHAKWLELDAERKAVEERERARVARERAEAERKIADEARRKAEAERREVAARAAAEAEAKAAVKRAQDDAARKIAHAQAMAAAQARAEAEQRARVEDDRAKASERLARESDKAAKGADKSAAAADKKVAKARAGDTSDTGTAHVSNNSGENEWYTPAIYVDAARDVLGGFDLDPASSEVANRTVRAERIFTAQDNGLAQEWPVGAIWCNPPYSQPLMGQFATRLAQAARDGSQVIVLVNNATETAWFQTIAAECSAICFPKTRIRFLDPDGLPSGSPLQGQAIIYSGSDVASFTEVFCQFGLVVRRG
jgi:phage N-6-adenine-methyltransferase